MTRRSSAITLLISVGMLSAGHVRVAAQSQATAAIRGVVVDETDQAVSDALVTVRHTLTGSENTALSDTDGAFQLLLLPPGGPYTVSVSRIGYALVVVEDVHLSVGRTHTLRVVLRDQPLEIEGLAARVRRDAVFDRSQIGPATLLDGRTLQAAPIASRDIMEMAILAPLVRTTESGGFSVAGQNDRYNAILVDGLLNQDAFGLTSGGVPGGQAGAKLLPLDAIAQYEVLVAPYDASLSGFAGGVMNAVTKTGTNAWELRASAVTRTESLMGDLNLPTGSLEASGVHRSLVSVSGGGPIRPDRAHFFISGEFERRERPPSGFNLGRASAALVGVVPEVLEDFQEYFDDAHGVETGIAGPYELGQSLANVFGRLDWSLGAGRRLTVRNVVAWATNDESPNRTPFQPYELSSNAVERTSVNNTASVQFFSDVGRDAGNELSFTVQRTTDRTSPASSWPQVEVVLRNPDEAVLPRRAVRAGAQFFAQQNDLAQTNVRLANTFTIARGRHTWSFGALGTWHDIRHTYLPGANGDWQFASWTDVLANAPTRYQRSKLLDDHSAGVGFTVLEAGAFVQDEVRFASGLTLHAGVRVESPFLMDRPPENGDIATFFERSTADVPSGMLLLSPRLGINWQSSGRLRTQIRGGAGVFTGQLPYVWLSNAFHNTGERWVTEVCTGRRTDDPPTGNTAPAFSPGPGPQGCLAGPPIEVRAVTLFDEDFEYPQYVKLSAAIDREITPRISASLGVISTHSLKQVALRELNISPQSDVDVPLAGYGGPDRPLYGAATDDGFAPIRPLPAYDQVVLVTNGYGDRSWSVSAEVRGELPAQMTVQAGYAYARSYDRMSLASVDLIANFGLTPTRADPNDPPLTPSNFDRPHKVLLSLHGSPIPALANTEISLLYTGESGLPFSYVYEGDYNGDGYPAAGPAFDRNNDIFYVPFEATNLPSSIGTVTRLAAALETDECLKRYRGRFLVRNHCRAPWQHRLDLRMSHAARIGGAEFQLSADVINLLNLMNSDWGLVRTIPATAALIRPLQRTLGSDELISEWAGGLFPFRGDDGELITPEPWSLATPASQWQAQFGLRVTLGG